MSNTEHEALSKQAAEWAEKQEFLRPIGKLAGFFIGIADSWTLWRDDDAYWTLLKHINTPAYQLKVKSPMWRIVFWPMNDTLTFTEHGGSRQLVMRRRGTNNWVADTSTLASKEELQDLLDRMSEVSPLEAMSLLSEE